MTLPCLKRPCHAALTVALLPVLLHLLAGCSPTLDWRETRPPGAVVLFPCKPTVETRPVRLAGAAPAPLTMSACEAGGAMFALASLDVGDASRVPAALAALREAQAGNLGATPGPGGAAPRRRGAPSDSPVERFRLAGRLPDGTPIQQDSLYLARGTRVYQALVQGRTVPQAAVDTFFEGIELAP